MPRGGKRAGQPGKAYQNRTDMNQPVRVVTGQQYGQRQALENAQRVVPLPNNAGPAAVATSPSMAAGPAVQPGSMPFAGPTDRPNEPVTAGLPVGPGPGPEALGMAPDIVGAQLRALYKLDPNNDVLRLIELHDRGF